MEEVGPVKLDARAIAISKDKFTKFQGSARILIKHLKFKNPCRPVDRNIVAQLKRDFKGEGCIRGERNHRVPAVIESAVLQTCLEKLGITIDEFRSRDATEDEPLWLKFESAIELECLHGQHRIVAAREYFPPPQRWWVVDLYGTDLEEDTTKTFREGYSYSAKYTSGEVFRYIRLCNRDNDRIGEQRWRVRLTTSQNRFLQQLLKRPELLKVLDSLLYIRGLWKDFFLGSLDVFLAVKCDEEITNYLTFMRETWSMILGGETARSDPASIESIQSRAPNLSRSDFDFIDKHMRSGKLFPQITDSKIRGNINKRLLGISSLIPSMHTLIKDIRYLKPAAKMMNILIPKYKMRSIRQRYEHIFESKEGSMEIQDGVSSYRIMNAEDMDRFSLDYFDISYRQLWLCSFRICKDSNAYGRLQLATLASRLGFSSSEITRELKRDPNFTTMEKAVLDVLHTHRPNENFTFDPANAEELLDSFKNYITQALNLRPHSSTPWITVHKPGEPLTRRCGHGPMDTLDLNHLFLDNLHNAQQHQNGGDEISSFYVKLCRYLAFFKDTHPENPSLDTSFADAPVNPQFSTVEPDVFVYDADETIENPSIPEGPNDTDDSNREEPISRPKSDDNDNINTIFHKVNEETRSVSEYSGTSENQPVAKPTIVIFEQNYGRRRIYKIPLDKEAVQKFAEELVVKNNKNLSMSNGHHFHWNECWENIMAQRDLKVYIHLKEPASILGKRGGMVRDKTWEVPDNSRALILLHPSELDEEYIEENEKPSKRLKDKEYIEKNTQPGKRIM